MVQLVHHHHTSFMDLGHLLTRSGLTYPDVSSKVYICPASFHETCQWLKFPLNGLWAQSGVSLVVGLLPLASGPSCLEMAFPPFLVKQLYRCDSVVISSFVRTGYTTRRWGWPLGRIGYNITRHYPLYPVQLVNSIESLQESMPAFFLTVLHGETHKISYNMSRNPYPWKYLQTRKSSWQEIVLLPLVRWLYNVMKLIQTPP